MLRLTSLNPCWVGAGGEGITDRDGNAVPERTGVGLSFDCPCGCLERVYVQFENPRDGGPVHDPKRPAWRRIGDDFATLTLKPSIRRTLGCRWHGFITFGEVASC